MRAGATCAAVAALFFPTVAHAHTPLARDLRLSPDGEGVAVRMPGFGWLVRAEQGEPFAYLCDAALGVGPLDAEPPFAYRADGALLVGTASGLRVVAPDGCPERAGSELSEIAVTALETHPDDPDVVYAVAGSEPALYRSRDGGSTWTRGAPLSAPGTVTALVLVPGDVEALYVGQSSAAGSAIVSRSSDGGASFEAFVQDREIVVLDAEGGLWARASAETPPRVALLHADEPAGPWQEVLRLNFFGGLAHEQGATGDVVWAGDEGGGVFRSEAPSDGFDEVDPDAGVACLRHGRDALWACTPGTPMQPAVATLSAPGAAFEPVVALAEVDRLVACEPDLAVEEACAAAWREWRIDVLGEGIEILTPPSTDGGAERDASMQSLAGDAGPTGPGRGSGCALASLPLPRSIGFEAWVLLAVCGFAAVRARVAASMPASRDSGSTDSAPDDAALVERAARGDVDAFAAIYDRHAAAVLALLLRMLRSEAEARDLLHDVFLEAWRSVRAYDAQRASVRTWLFVRARSRALDRAGKLVRAAEARRSIAPAQAHAAEHGRALERQFAVRRALSGLDADVRVALELTYYEGLTAVEIGARTGAPVGTVKSRLARGLAALAVVLENAGGTTDGRG